jgi:hypothetical protein
VNLLDASLFNFLITIYPSVVAVNHHTILSNAIFIVIVYILYFKIIIVTPDHDHDHMQAGAMCTGLLFIDRITILIQK